MSRSHVAMCVALVVCGTLAAESRAQERSVATLLDEIRDARSPTLDASKRGDQASVTRFLTERQEVMKRRCELIGELYRVDPKNAELVKLLPERWAVLAQGQMTRGPEGALKAELDAAMSEPGSESLRTEAAFVLTMMAVRMPDGEAAQKIATIEKFAKLAPKDPRGAVLLYMVAMQAKSAADQLAFYKKLAEAYPDHPFTKSAQGNLRRLEAVGKPFDLEFKDAIKGTTVSMKDLRGKVVVIDFWATWCGPCVSEMPKMKSLYAAYRDKGVEFIGVSLDQPEDQGGGLTKLKEFVAKNEITWPQYYEGKGWENDFSKSWGVDSIPCVFVIDKDGNLAAVDARGKLSRMIPSMLGVEFVAPEPLVTPTGRDVSGYDHWTYDSDEAGKRGYLKKEDGKNWVEVKDGAVWSRFKEVKRTHDYIELYDDSRDLSARLYDGTFFWKTDEDWNLLPFHVIGTEK